MNSTEWHPISTAPRGKNILLAGGTPPGFRKPQILVGRYHGRYECSVEDWQEEWAETCPDDGEIYAPAGWHEAWFAHNDFTSCWLGPGFEPTHWMALPEGPK